MFRSGAHATVAVVALAAAVYATASLSGGWLGTPPWWEERIEGTAEGAIAIHVDYSTRAASLE